MRRSPRGKSVYEAFSSRHSLTVNLSLKRIYLIPFIFVSGNLRLYSSASVSHSSRLSTRRRFYDDDDEDEITSPRNEISSAYTNERVRRTRGKLIRHTARSERDSDSIIEENVYRYTLYSPYYERGLLSPHLEKSYSLCRGKITDSCAFRDILRYSFSHTHAQLQQLQPLLLFYSCRNFSRIGPAYFYRYVRIVYAQKLIRPLLRSTPWSRVEKLSL